MLINQPDATRRGRRSLLALGSVLLAGAATLAVPQAAYAAVNSNVNGPTLTVNSDGAADTIAVTCVGGNVQVNGAAPDTGVAACSTIAFVNVSGGLADDVIDMSGVDPAVFTQLFSVTVRGDAGVDTITGSPRADFLFGGPGNDTITGFKGSDLILGEADNDRMIWNNGDGSDTMAGGDEADTVEVNGAVNDADNFTVVPNGGRVRFDRTNLIPFALDIDETETLLVSGIGGNDTFAGAAGLAPLIRLGFNGGDGEDTLTGGDGDDVLAGGLGNDTITGFKGSDQMLGEADNDRMVWNNGDGSDLIEGAGGTDTVEVNGAVNDADNFTVNPNGARVRFDRSNLIPFALDIGTSENLLVSGIGGNDTFAGAAGLAPLIRLGFNGGDGEDTLTGGDGDDVLAGGLGNDTITGFKGSDQMLGEADNDRMVWNNGDGSDLIEGAGGTDTVEVNGAATDGDNFTVVPNGTRVRFDRLNLIPFRLDIGSTEALELDTSGGDDNAVAAGGLAALIDLFFEGGDGEDRLVGSNGDDLMRGGAGSDRIVGVGGDDRLEGDGGKDRITGGRGGDRLVGGGARDRFEGNGGRDRIDARGQRLEPVDCGGGIDRVKADRLDLVRNNCEVVRR